MRNLMVNDGYPDVKVFMATYRKAEAVVGQYNRELAKWERKAKESRRPAEKERYAPPERESVRDQLRRLQAEGKQQNTLQDFEVLQGVCYHCLKPLDDIGDSTVASTRSSYKNIK